MQPSPPIVKKLLSERVVTRDLPHSASALIALETLRHDKDLSILTIVPTESDAKTWAEDFNCLRQLLAPNLELSWLSIPAIEHSPYANASGSGENRLERLAAITSLNEASLGTPHTLISIPSLMQKSVPSERLQELTFNLSSKHQLPQNTFLNKLISAGYERISIVDDPGQFSVRGDVVDVYSPSYPYPIRIEYFGDDVETIRFFDSKTQRTLRPTDEVTFPPASEISSVFGGFDRQKILDSADAASQPSKETRLLLDKIENQEEFLGKDAYLPAFHKKLTSLVDDFTKRFDLTFVYDVDRCHKKANEKWQDENDRYLERLADKKASFPPSDFFEEPQRCFKLLMPKTGLVSNKLIPDKTDTVFDVNIEGHRELRNSLMQSRKHHHESPAKPLIEALNDWKDSGDSSVILCADNKQVKQLSAILQDNNVLFKDAPQSEKSQSNHLPHTQIEMGSLSEGVSWPALGVHILTSQDIWGGKRRAVKKRFDKTSKAKNALLGDVTDFSMLEPGHLLVHEVHGVGKYEEMVKLPIGDTSVDFLHISYKGGKLYLPVVRLHQVQRYVGAEGSKPKLDKLGGFSFAKAKQKAKQDAQALAEELLKLYAERAALPGHVYPKADAMTGDFDASFEFEETPDQADAIDDIAKDMESSRPMDRLVCGDVGYGKTEVALRAAFKAVNGGKQVAFLAPTTVLVEQHFKTMESRFAKWPIKVARLSRFQSQKEIKKTLGHCATGAVDVVAGTHRLLSKDVVFKDLGLVIVDEEQRFGVSHKETLKKLRTQVDVLTLTATPIPRTLHLAMTGLRDLSIIATPPADRRSIRTLISVEEDATFVEGLKKELSRKGQVYIVAPRIHQTADSVSLVDLAKRIERLNKDANVVIGHGQMKPKELESAMVQFVSGEANVLISTTIIESGIDIANANTMFIVSADKFGLSQLYQLRGRIGRSAKRAYCYLLVPSLDSITDNARKRLSTLVKHTELGAGFKIASQDLEIRGAGDLLGSKQSGSIASIGFSAYTELLEEAVAELRGEPLAAKSDPDLQIDVPSYIPDDYIEDVRQRLSFYKRFSSAANERELEDLCLELENRYGPVPEPTHRLARVMSLKNLAKDMGAIRLDLSPNLFSVVLTKETKIDPSHVMSLIKIEGSRYRLTPDMRLTYSFSDDEKEVPTESALAAFSKACGF